MLVPTVMEAVVPEDTSQVLRQLVAAYQLLWAAAQVLIPTTVVLTDLLQILVLYKASMEGVAVITTVQPADMEAVEVDLLLDTVQVAEQVAKAILVHRAAIIGQATAAAALPVQVLECKVAAEQPAQLQVLVCLEQVVVVVVEIVQSIAETAIQVVVEVTAVPQIGATAIIHTVKILEEDGELHMPILPILVQVAALVHTGHQTSAGIKAAATVPAA